jgi:4-hydroxy-tetrahydrodipicolinate synthase
MGLGHAPAGQAAQPRRCDIVVVGTTGESPTVDFEEHCRLIKITAEHVAGRVLVIAGTGANSTSEAIELQAFAKKAGADQCLSVVPYYNKPTQEGLYRHFKAIAEAVDIPMIVYNVPSRTVCDMHNDTAVRLAQVPNIAGIKDATGNLERGADLIRRAPKGFDIYSGDDASAAQAFGQCNAAPWTMDVIMLNGGLGCWHGERLDG